MLAQALGIIIARDEEITALKRGLEQTKQATTTLALMTSSTLPIGL